MIRDVVKEIKPTPDLMASARSEPEEPLTLRTIDSRAIVVEIPIAFICPECADNTEVSNRQD